jgi:HEAT repeat protein
MGWRVAWFVACRARDADPSVRGAVAAALAARGGWLAAVTLRRLISDEDPLVRYAALCALATFRGAGASALLARVAARDPEPWLRDAAASVLRRRGAPRAAVSTGRIRRRKR